MTLSQVEFAPEGSTGDACGQVFSERTAKHEALIAAGLMKQLASQINVVIHALGIRLCLPQLLQPGEVFESVSLGAGNSNWDTWP